jgi:membrane protease YdiL (CAAX protease family)
MLGAPLALIVTMRFVFKSSSSTLGYPLGYLFAFAVNWVFWCGLLPVAVVGRRGIATLFARGDTARARDEMTLALVAWPIAFPLICRFVPRVSQAGFGVLALSVCLGIVTGVAEEVLWRGAYLRLVPHRLCWSSVYPSLAFGIWHMAPLSVLPTHYPGGAAGFVVYSCLLGFSYSTVARRTQSIRWVVISHCVHDVLGLGGYAYAGWFV